MTSPLKEIVKEGQSLRDHWHAVLNVAVKDVFAMMAGVELRAPDLQSLPMSSEIAGMVGLAGQLCGVVTIRCSRTSANRIACHMLKVSEQEAVAHATDAIGEICNMVAGSFKARIGLEDKCMLSVPTVISGNNYEVHSLAAGEKVEVLLLLHNQPLWFTLQARV